MLIKLARNLTGGGKSPQPIDNAREYSLPRLGEQGASKRRIGLYLARWLGWATISLAPGLSAYTCATPPFNEFNNGVAICRCDSTFSVRATLSNAYGFHTPGEPSTNNIHLCTNASFTQCATLPNPHTTTSGTYYFKNTTETSSYFSCDYDTATQLFSNPQNHNITPALPTPVPFAPTALLFALFASLGSFFAYRVNRNKSQKGN